MSNERKTLTRRALIRYVGMAAAASALAGCQPQPTATPVPPPPTKAAAATAVPATKAPAATAVPPTKAPMATTGPAATPAGDKWAIYPDDDGRHWLLDKKVEPLKQYDNLVITQNYHLSNATFKSGEAVDDNVKTRWLKKHMGIAYKAVWSGTREADYWPIALASGDLAECLTNMSQQAYVQLREADKLADITEIWERTASSLTKKKKRYPDGLWWQVYREKGRIYSIPCTGVAHNGENIFWVRQDWLDKVGHPFPRTLEDVYKVGQAFVAAGLSKFGLWVGNTYNLHTSMDFVFGAHGTMPRQWRRGSDGKLAYTSLEPAQKDALAVLAKWYKDGLLHPEFLASADANKYIAGNLAGMAPGPWWWSVVQLQTSIANDPSAKWAFGHLPTGPGGKRGRAADPMLSLVTAFRKGIDPIKIEAFINQLNWFYEIEDNNNAGTGDSVLKFLGYDYDKGEAGKLVAGKTLTTRYNPGGFDFNATRYPELNLVGYTRTAKQAATDPSELNPLQIYFSKTDPTRATLGAGSIRLAFQGAEYGILSDYNWPIPTSQVELQTSLMKLEDEAYANIITGRNPVNAWDEFVVEWRRQGGDKLAAALNAEDAKRK